MTTNVQKLPKNEKGIYWSQYGLSDVLKKILLNIFSNFYFMTQFIINSQNVLNRYPDPIKNMFLPIANFFC